MKYILTAGAPFPPKGPATVPENPISTPSTDPGFDEKTRAELQEHVAILNQHLQLLANYHDEPARAAQCNQFRIAVQALEKCTTATWTQTIARVAAALEALLGELQSKPSQINDSRLRTLSLAVDVLGILIRTPELGQQQISESAAVVLDAERVSCTAACNALRNAGFTPAKFSDPELALNHLSSNPVDLVVLDMSAGGESGFELDNKLRELPLHHDTAVIFVTDFSETKYPPGTVSNSETQFLAKPNNMLSYLELALKALSRVLKLRASSPPKALPAPVDPEARHEHDSDTTDNCANNAPAEPDTAVPTHGPDAGRKAIEPTEEPTMTTPLNHRPQPNESQTKPHAPAMNGEAGKRTPDQEKEFAELWQMCDELTRELAAEKKSAAEAKHASEEREKKARQNGNVEGSEVAESERRLRESVAACARATSDLEKERAERRRIEQRAAFLANQLPELHGQLKQHLESESLNQNRTSQLEQQLREREEALARVSADLEKEKEERQLAEQQLHATGDLSAHLRDCLASFEAAKQAFKRTQEQMEAQMQESLKATSASEARLQKEASERQRAEDALAAVKRTLQEQSTEFSKLQAALQVEQAERQRLQGDAIQARYSSLGSARVGLTAGNRLRRQMRDPVESVMKATRRLLENALEEEPKKLVESILENALLLQSSLQEKETVNALASGDAAATGASQQPTGASSASGDSVLAAA